MATPGDPDDLWTQRSSLDLTTSAALRAVLGDAQARRFVGNLDLADHLANAAGFIALLDDESVTHVVDLGSGGGLPALVIAEHRRDLRLTLVERGTNRASFLTEAVDSLGYADRVVVVPENAETAARLDELSGSAEAVTARSFGPPAVTAEAACRFLREGGRLIVSEPPPEPGAPSRWPVAPLAPTGLEPTDRFVVGTHSFQVLRRSTAIEDRLPRRPAVTRKRPLF